MNEEQKVRALQVLRDWEETSYSWDQADVGAYAIDLIKELVATDTQAPAVQPDAYEVVPSCPIALAAIGVKHFGNPIPKEWYSAALDLLKTGVEVKEKTND